MSGVVARTRNEQDPHAGDETVGGWDTAMDRGAFDALYRNPQASMRAGA